MNRILRRSCLTGALVLCALVATGGATAADRSSSYMPAAVQHKIAALFGAQAYIPGWLPAGFIYISWKPQPPSGPNGSIVYGRFTITFAHSGKVLLWHMDDPTDSYDCTSNYANAHATIRGRRVSFINGNHGQSGIWCFGGTPGHRYEVSTWDDHVFSPAVEMKMAAYAALAH